MRDSVLIYRSFWEALKQLPAEDRLAAITAIIDYGLYDVEPDISGVALAIFLMAKPLVDKNNTRYQNGMKGGRPKTKEEPNKNQTETKSEANVNDNVKDNVNVNDNIKTSCPEAETAPAEIAVSFVLNDGTMYNVTENDVVMYQQLYPGIDCRQELRNIVGWCDANPKNRKTRSGAKRFVNGWLSRSQNKAKPTQIKQEKPPNKSANFTQREYDMSALEKQLLSKNGG